MSTLSALNLVTSGEKNTELIHLLNNLLKKTGKNWYVLLRNIDTIRMSESKQSFNLTKIVTFDINEDEFLARVPVDNFKDLLTFTTIDKNDKNVIPKTKKRNKIY